MSRQSPYMFFKVNAGFGYDPLRQTPEQGKQENARQLAAAEKWARDNDYSFDWQVDQITDSTEWIADDEDGGKNRDPWLTWECIMRDAEGKVRQSLHAIDFGRDGTPWSDTYRRVVEAQLADAQRMEGAS